MNMMMPENDLNTRKPVCIPKEFASKIYDVLVEHLGASETWREQFIRRAYNRTTEFRFKGDLGMGGKFWNVNRRWYVNTYPEDMREGDQEKIDLVNKELMLLRGSWTSWVINQIKN